MRRHFGVVLAFLTLQITAASAQTVSLHCGAPGASAPYTLTIDLATAQVTFAYDNPGFQNQNYSVPARITDSAVAWDSPPGHPPESLVLSRYTEVLMEYLPTGAYGTPCSGQKSKF